MRFLIVSFVMVYLHVSLCLCFTDPENITNLEELIQLKMAHYDFNVPYDVPNKEPKESFPGIEIPGLTTKRLLNLDIIRTWINQQSNEEFERSDRTEMYYALTRPLDHPTTKEAILFPGTPFLYYYVFNGEIMGGLITKIQQKEQEPKGFQMSDYSKEDLVKLSIPMFAGVGLIKDFENADTFSMGKLGNKEAWSQSPDNMMMFERNRKYYATTVNTANTLSKALYLEYSSIALFDSPYSTTSPEHLKISVHKIPLGYRHLIFNETQYHFVANYLFEKILREFPKSYKVLHNLDDIF